MLSSVKKIKCRASENKRNFLEIQCGREKRERKNSMWKRDGGYQLSDGGKGKKKGRTVPFMQCSNEANKLLEKTTRRCWMLRRMPSLTFQSSCPSSACSLASVVFMLSLIVRFFFLPDSYVAGAYCNFRNET